MSKPHPIALLAGLATLLVFANGARADVTIDLLFQGQASPGGITISAGDPGPGCAFGGYYGGSVSTGYCMDVMLYTPETLLGLSASVAYDSDNGLGVGSFYEWKGVGVSFNKVGTLLKECAPFDGVSDDGSQVGDFDCWIPPPNGPPYLTPGTYRIGTIVWNTSGTTTGTERIRIVDAIVGVMINGNGYHIALVPHLLGSHVLNIVPEPGTAALLGLGLVGLVLSARRRQPPTQ